MTGFKVGDIVTSTIGKCYYKVIGFTESGCLHLETIANQYGEKTPKKKHKVCRKLCKKVEYEQIMSEYHLSVFAATSKAMMLLGQIGINQKEIFELFKPRSL